MKSIKKEPKKNIKKTSIKENAPKKVVPIPKKTVDNKTEDVQRLVHLLQVHQIELEHQNQELRISQEELEISRSKYVNLFDFSPIPYISIDMNYVIWEVNISASKMFGIDRNKLIGAKLISFISPDHKDSFTSFIKTVFSSSTKCTNQFLVVNKEKKIFHVQLEAIKFQNPLEVVQKCQIALIDLTEFKKIENSLKEYTEELKKLNHTKDKLFSIIAHDLRSPFQSLLVSSELLATEIENLTHEEIITFSKGLNYNLKNIYTMLKNLLDWSLMQRSLLEYNPQLNNLLDIVNENVAISHQLASKKNITIINNIDADTFVYADSDMIRSVVQNLLSNAIKFTPKDGQIVISSTRTKKFVDVKIKDSGIGIDATNISKLFKLDTLFSINGTEGEKGTGLGLLLCKEFVERNGGKISIDSQLGKGSTFSFSLLKDI